MTGLGRLLVLLFIFQAARAGAQTVPSPALQALRERLDSITGPYKGIIGIAIQNLDDPKEKLMLEPAHRFPMQSVYKLPLAMAVLHEVDAGRMNLGQQVKVHKKDLRWDTWSPLRDKYPNGNVTLTLAELLTYTVSSSDNNTCDILFGLMKGTAPVNRYIHSIGVKKMGIAATEFEMSRNWQVQYNNWTQPEAMLTLLSQVYEKKNMSDSSQRFLMGLMTESANSAKRIKGQLPAGTVVAHKTGTGNTNNKGITSAMNDVGIITTPGGKQIALAVFISDTPESYDTAEKIIADIALAVYQYYTLP